MSKIIHQSVPKLKGFAMEISHYVALVWWSIVFLNGELTTILTSETTLESMLIDAEPKCMVNSSDSDFSMDNGVEREEDESTPQPRGLEKKASVLDLSSADEPYETPMTLRRKNRGVAIKRKREQVADTTDNGKKKRTVGDTFNNVRVNLKRYCCSLLCSI